MNAFAAAEKDGRADRFLAELRTLFMAQNQSAHDSSTSIPATYLRVTVQRPLA